MFTKIYMKPEPTHSEQQSIQTMLLLLQSAQGTHDSDTSVLLLQVCLAL